VVARGAARPGAWGCRRGAWNGCAAACTAPPRHGLRTGTVSTRRPRGARWPRPRAADGWAPGPRGSGRSGLALLWRRARARDVEMRKSSRASARGRRGGDSGGEDHQPSRSGARATLMQPGKQGGRARAAQPGTHFPRHLDEEEDIWRFSWDLFLRPGGKVGFGDAAIIWAKQSRGHMRHRTTLAWVNKATKAIFLQSSQRQLGRGILTIRRHKRFFRLYIA